MATKKSTKPYVRPPQFEAAVTLIAGWRHITRTHEYDDKWNVIRWITPDLDEIKDEVREWLDKERFSHFEFEEVSEGSCETCYMGYPGLAFYGEKKRQSFVEIDVDELGELGGLNAIYQAMKEAGV